VSLTWDIVFGGDNGQLRSVPSSPACCVPGLSTSLPYSPEKVISPDDGAWYQDFDAGPNGEYVHVKADSSADHGEVWVSVALGQYQLAIEDGFEPAISPDSSRVSFTRLVGGLRSVWVANLDGTNAHRISPDPTTTDNASSYSASTWSPDGITVAFTRMSDWQVFTAPAAGSAVATSVEGLIGYPAYQTNARNLVRRLAGASRFDTAIAASQLQWEDWNGPSGYDTTAHSVVLTRSDTYADALAGAALAAAKQGPLLLTPPTQLQPATAREIDRILQPGKTIYILGSTVAISASVADQLSAKGYNVVRLAGPDRYATAVAIANEINGDPDMVLVASGTNFPDALAAGAAAGSYDAPVVRMKSKGVVVLLTVGDKLPTATRDYLDMWTQWSPGHVPYAIGAPAAAALAQRYTETKPIVGANRYETALLVAHYFFGGETLAGVATGTNWPDALSGGALMGTLNGPLLLTPSTGGLNPYTGAFLRKEAGSISTGLIFGSSVAVPAATDAAVGAAISGPAGYNPG
jgi:putative cell wall-binding protein